MDNTEREVLEVIVVGGGLAGLCAARLCQRAGARVVVVEPHALGGRARTDVIDGFSFNLGPHALYMGGPAQRILGELGIVPTGGPPAAKATFGVLAGKVGVLPVGPVSLLKTRFVGAKGKLGIAKVLGTLPRIKADEHANETVRQWIESLRVPDDAAALLLMLVRIATYADAPDLLSADVAISQLQYAVGKGVLYIDGGWQSMVDRLAQGVDVRIGRVTRVGADATSGQRAVAVELDNGDVLVARSVIVASGLPETAARLLGREPFVVGPPLEAACLELGLRAIPERRVVMGIDQPLYFSVHSPPARLAPSGMAVAAVARYIAPLGSGGTAPGPSASPAQARAELEAHARHSGLTADDIVTARYLHRMTVVAAMATAATGGLTGRTSVDASGVPNVFLAGDWVGPVGHLADASLASAEAAAGQALAAAGIAIA